MHRLRRVVLLGATLAIVLTAAALPVTPRIEPAGPRDGPPTGTSRSAVPAPADGSVAGRIREPAGGDDPRVTDGSLAKRASSAGASSAAVVPTAEPTSPLRPGSVDRTSVLMSTTYDVALNLSFGTRVITVDTRLSATNTSGGPVDRLELNTIAARLGGLKLTAATVEDEPVDATVADQTITVPLGGTLPEGATVRARLTYRATLRSDLRGSNWLFTRVNGIANLYRWLPWVSRATPFDRPNHGDPFVTAVSPRVTVSVTTDRPLVLATSGDRVSVSGLTQRFEARNVRDFVIAAAPDFRKAIRTVGDTKVIVYYRPGFPATATLDNAARALSRMSALVGPYPYRNYRVAQSAGGYGMEAPGLIWIPTGVSSSNLPYLVHHETAHQWFYALVGADQAREPFVDEAAADFLARHALGMKRGSRCSTARLDLTIYRYSAACYYEIVYIQGGNFLDDVRRRMGSTAFWTGLRAWVEANRFAIGRTRSLLDTLDAYTSLNLVPRYEPRFPRLY